MSLFSTAALYEAVLSAAQNEAEKCSLREPAARQFYGKRDEIVKRAFAAETKFAPEDREPLARVHHRYDENEYWDVMSPPLQIIWCDEDSVARDFAKLDKIRIVLREFERRAARQPHGE